ncbi:tonsoku-like protein [Hydractinia symbiolongicarpus]|uniref:tonsoku-like protein n=1 Tax=Hydractinia symbiolongicarpus TaxID=13093 RepID=UPI0025511799|nr:tonsoku-like protein [Hydractinia symbiolongicarpus]
MNKSAKKEINDLRRLKLKAKQREDLQEAAKICNCIGEVFSSNELFEEAITEHLEEIGFSEAVGDVIGVAVGNRKVGECLCLLGDFQEALKYQQKHFEISKDAKDLLEQQRALATIGRTYFLQAENLTNKNEINNSLRHAQKSYLNSLDIANNLHDVTSDKEVLEMKARLYLNLGLIYDWEQDTDEALKFVLKALVISREQKLYENIFKCHFTLSGIYVNTGNYIKALQSAKASLNIAQEQNDKGGELDALSQMGLVLLYLREFEPAKQALKKVYKQRKSDQSVIKNLKTAITGVHLTAEYQQCENKKNLLALCEKLGDLYAEIKCPKESLKYYLQQMELAKYLSLSKKELAVIYASIAVTYSDCKEYHKALKFYQMELDSRQNEYKEKSATYCAIAKVHEDLGSPLSLIEEYYMKGLDCAQISENKLAEIKVYEDLSETLKSFGNLDKLNEIVEKMKNLQEDCSEEDEFEEQSESSSIELNQDELLAIESENDEEHDQEEVHLESKHGRKKTSRSTKKINKINERGETPLHVAAISGNLQSVKTLLEQGAYVHSRDYCGWQPLHEACNHGFYDIAALLIEYGANVSDPGGSHCGGITPLHDACQNGHLRISQLLVEKGASTDAKTNEGYTPLDLLQIAIEADEEEFTKKQCDKTTLMQRKEVEKFLLSLKTSKKSVSKRLVTDRNQTLFDQSSSESDEDLQPDTRCSKRQKLSTSPPVCSSFTIDDPMGSSPETQLEDDSSQELLNRNVKEKKKKQASLKSYLNDTPPKMISSDKSFKTNNTKKQKKNNTIQNSFNALRKSYSDTERRDATHSPSLLNENDPSLESFIIDDIPQKRKKTPNEPQLRERRSFSSGRVAPKQTTLMEVASPNTFAQRNPLFRIKIHVGEQLFLISCQDVHNLTIDWLLDEAKKRYHSKCKVSARLSLKTIDGALLDASDIIGNVLMNNEEIVADITGLELEPTIERYKRACGRLVVDPIDEISNQIHPEDLFDQLSLQNLFLSTPDVQAVADSISFNTKLTIIDVSQTYLGDDKCSILIGCLPSLPNIQTLNLSCTGITTKSLAKLSATIKEKLKEELKMITKDTALSSLTVLMLDHNDFHVQTEFVHSMCDILTYCKQLEVLNLQSCKLNATTFTNHSRFVEILQVSTLTSLDVSFNVFDDQTVEVLKCLNKQRISDLNISGVLSPRKSVERVHQDVATYISENLTSLRKLSINRFPADVLTNFNNKMKCLSLQHPSSTENNLRSFIRWDRLPHLSSLNLSFCKDVDNEVLGILIHQSSQKNSTLRKLHVSSCSVTSPLPDQIFKHLFCGSNSLQYIDASYNDLNYEDKDELLASWAKLHGDVNIKTTLHDSLCVLSYTRSIESFSE